MIEQIEQVVKTIIYCRVSTQEQVKGFSLEGQERECRAFAERAGYTIEKTFIELGESAKTDDRPQLQAALTYCQTQRGIVAIIVWKLDRFTRNSGDYHIIARQLGKHGVRILSATESNDRDSSGNLNRNMIAAIAQFENEVRAERTVAGMKGAVRAGRWVWRPPFGYRRIIGADGKAWIAPIEGDTRIQTIFTMFDSGKPQSEIAEAVNLQQQHIGKILTNPLYCGLIKAPWFDEYMEGKHEAIISKAQFFRVQEMLRGAGNIPTPHIRAHPDFPLRGFIRCENCGRKLTAAWCAGKSNKYPYYFCPTRGCSMTIARKILEQQFYDLLETLSPQDSMLAEFREVVAEVWRDRRSALKATQQSAALKLNEAEKKRKRIEDLLIAGSIDEDTYRERSAEVKSEIMDLKLRANEAHSDRGDLDAAWAYCQHFLAHPGRMWADASVDIRRRVQTFVFPDGVYFSKISGFRTPTIASIFNYLHDPSTLKNTVGVPTLCVFEQLANQIQEISQWRLTA